MFKKYEHKRIVFGDGKLTANNFKEVNKNTLIEFVQRYSLPFVVDFNHDSAQKAFRGWVHHHLLIFASRGNHSWDLINQQASAVAKKEEFYMILLNHIKCFTRRKAIVIVLKNWRWSIL